MDLDYTLKTHEEIIDIVDKLLAIDSDNLDAEAIRGVKIFGEINRIYIQFGRKLIKLTDQKAKVEHQRYRYYAGKASKEYYQKEPLHEAILKGDIHHYMNIDPIVVEMRNLVKECEATVKYLEEAKATLKSRGYDLKTAVAFRQMMMGG